MKLTYRGVSYEYTQPQVELNQLPLEGRYRGNAWRFFAPKQQYTNPIHVGLSYRGVKCLAV